MAVALAATLVALSLSAVATAAVAPLAPAWTQDFPMDVSSGAVAVDRDGNTYVSGTRGEFEHSIGVLRKVDASGSVVWVRTWRPEPSRAHVAGGPVALAPDGSVYMAGSVGSSHFEGGGWFLRKYRSDGTLEWARDEPGWQHGRTGDFPTGLAVSRGLVLLAGSFEGCCGDFRIFDGWVLAFGDDGSHRWRAPFEAPGLGAFSDETDDVAAGAGGGIFVVGWAALGPESDMVAAPHELFLQRLDRAGGVVWSRVYPETAHRDQHFGADLVVHGDALTISALVDGHPVAERYGGRPGHAWLGRFTLGGDLVWSRVWGRSWTGAAQPVAVTLDASDRAFVAGTVRDPSDHGLDAFVRSYSRAGHLRWSVRLQHGQRRMEGSGAAWGAGGISVSGEATGFQGRALRGYLWRFPVA
jgi:hypothetical protein